MQDIACHEFMAMSCIGYLLQFQPGSVSHRDIQGFKVQSLLYTQQNSGYGMRGQ